MSLILFLSLSYCFRVYYSNFRLKYCFRLKFEGFGDITRWIARHNVRSSLCVCVCKRERERERERERVRERERERRKERVEREKEREKRRVGITIMRDQPETKLARIQTKQTGWKVAGENKRAGIPTWNTRKGSTFHQTAPSGPERPFGETSNRWTFLVLTHCERSNMQSETQVGKLTSAPLKFFSDRSLAQWWELNLWNTSVLGRKHVFIKFAAVGCREGDRLISSPRLWLRWAFPPRRRLVTGPLLGDSSQALCLVLYLALVTLCLFFSFFF